ncbi:PIN domain-containing protein [Sandaracinobacteroides hominis]|uniref:PIN domain-containing protein n=1 Tax=Sandaracinobacteroides hominis TaxID=2780086 RepID=UPI0018F4D0A9|nr:PIN domain-containing protein [Sandaracinobacteroides hominis]
MPRHNLFLSVLSLLELQSGAADTGRKDRKGGADLAERVSTQVVPAFEGRLLPVDVATVRRRATLPYTDQNDGLMAATALEHGLTLVTRNTAAFKAGRVRLFNPWGYAPEEEDGDWRQASRAGPQWFKNLFVRV